MGITDCERITPETLKAIVGQIPSNPYKITLGITSLDKIGLETEIKKEHGIETKIDGLTMANVSHPTNQQLVNLYTREEQVLKNILGANHQDQDKLIHQSRIYFQKATWRIDEEDIEITPISIRISYYRRMMDYQQNMIVIAKRAGIEINTTDKDCMV